MVGGQELGLGVRLWSRAVLRLRGARNWGMPHLAPVAVLSHVLLVTVTVLTFSAALQAGAA